MWVHVSDTVRFGNRRAIATIDRTLFVNAGIPLKDIRLFSQIPEFNEDLVRKVLRWKYKNVGYWQLHVVQYVAETDSIDVLVSSPEFDEVPEGQKAPRI